MVSQRSGNSQRTVTATLIVFAFVMYFRPQGATGAVILIGGALLVGISVSVGLTPCKPPLLLSVFVGIALASALWSSHPQETLTLAVALIPPLVIAGIIAKNFAFEDFLRIADRTLKALVVVSVAVAFAVPSIGITQRIVNQGTMRGVFEHRNGLGYVIVVALITHLAVTWGVRKNFAARMAWLAFFALGLYFTGSSGAVVLTVVTLLIYGVLRLLDSTRQNRGPTAVALACLGVASLPLIPAAAPALLGALGRDSTLTGRTDIWEGGLLAWREVFWTGFGWANIIGEESTASRTISALTGYAVRSTHNGYIATALQLGVFGLAASLLILAVLLIRGLREAVTNPSPQSVWGLLIIVALIAGDLGETRAFVNVGWFLLAIVASYPAKRQDVERSQRLFETGRRSDVNRQGSRRQGARVHAQPHPALNSPANSIPATIAD